MKIKRLLIPSSLGLGLTLAVGLFAFIGRAAPGNPALDPPRNSHTAPLTTTISISYDEPISAATVTSHTFAVHGMQSGLMTATHGVVNGNTIVVTPTRPFHQGELVYAIATTHTLNITGTGPLSPTLWQFNSGWIVTRCVGAFTDIAADLPAVEYGSATWGDYDNDGDLDILLSGGIGGTPRIARVYRNDGGGAFSEETNASLPGVVRSSAAWGDYDNDGDLDILLSGRALGGGSWIRMTAVYRNDGGGTFITETNASLPGVDDGSAAWGDYDNDGDLDILLSGWRAGPLRTTTVYRNDGGGTFTDAGADLTGVGYSSVAWGDYDNDGDLDILLSGNTGLDPATTVYRNDGAGTFTDIAANLPGVEYGSVAWGDYDNDGDLDILFSGTGAYPDRYASVYRNDGGTFIIETNASLTGVDNSSVTWGDYDNDGDLDILLTGLDASSTRIAQVYRNEGEGTFITETNTSLTGVDYGSVVWGDYDNDGDLDILLTGSHSVEGRITRLYSNDDCAALVVTKQADPDPVQAGAVLTYTIRVTNTGGVTLTATVTDTLPISITLGETSGETLLLPDGAVGITWTALIPAPDGVWTETIVVTVTEGYSGTLTNLVQVTSSEGAPGSATVISQVQIEKKWGIYLPLVLRNTP